MSTLATALAADLGDGDAANLAGNPSHYDIDLWLEIEGLPWAFGIRSHAASFFAGRTAQYQRRGVKGLLLKVPSGIEQQGFPLEGRSSVGSYTAEILDDDSGPVLDLVGNSARSDKVLTLGAGLPASSAALASLPFSGAAAEADYPSGGGIVYLGRETLAYASRTATAFLGVTRGMYQLPGRAQAYEHLASDWITPYPRFLATRHAALFMSTDGTDAGRRARFGGVVRTAPLLPGLTALSIDIESVQADLAPAIFGGQRRAKLTSAIPDGLGNYSQSSTNAAVISSEVASVDATALTGDWARLGLSIWRIGDEYFAAIVQNGAAGASLRLVGTNTGRGLFTSATAEHAPRDEVLEVLWTGRHRAIGTSEERAAFFSAGDNPLEVVLQLLCSRQGDGANGAYDTLPAGCGLGLDQGVIDIAGILKLRDDWMPSERHLEPVEDRAAARDVIAKILLVHGCWYSQTVDGLLTVRRGTPPIPGLTQREIVVDGLIDIPTWDSMLAEVYGRVVLKCDYDPTNSSTQKGPFRQTYTAEIVGAGNEAQEFYAGQFKELVVEARGQWGGALAGVTAFGADYETSAGDVAAHLAQIVAMRYARPFPEWAWSAPGTTTTSPRAISSL